jgi:arylsulfatase A-like enzyme
MLRGFKGDLWEGGHREPFVARWPGKIKPASQSDELLCLVDTLATCAAVTGQALPTEAGPDSVNMLPALLGEKRNKPLREHLVLQSNGSRRLAIRKGPWKLIPAAGGQGKPQLYNLKEDVRETNNLAAQRPDLVRELSSLLAELRQRGRSRP